VWKNLPVTKIKLIDGLNHISDHLALKVSLLIGAEIKRTLPYKAKELYIAAHIRKAKTLR
jgi:hypothetical protein